MQGLRVGFAMCGSFCTFDDVIPQMEAMVMAGAEVTPIMSETASSLDTRFGSIAHFIARIESACGKPIINTIRDAEPIGPKKPFDVMVVAPCTGNTLGKLANGIYDTSVTLAVKAHLRNERPVVLAVSTNDALSYSAENIGTLLGRRHIYFVPMGQDNPYAKPRSVVADMTQIPAAVQAAAQGQQIQPMLIAKYE